MPLRAITDTPSFDALESGPARFERGSLIHEAGRFGFPWRVVEGTVRFDVGQEPSGEHSFAGLAATGDLVGVEVLMFGHFAYRATALTTCILEPWPGHLGASRDTLLQALLRSERRAAEVVALRSGQALARVSRLISMLLPDAATAQQKTELPFLRDMADITALTVETVSRTLSGLRRQGALVAEKERRGQGSKTPCLVHRDLLACA